MKIEQKLQTAFLGLFAFGMLLVSSGCGKNESAGGLFGGAGGAAVGAVIAGPNNAGLGAVIGGLAGYAVGSGVGRAADDEDTKEEMDARERSHQRDVTRLEREKDRIRQEQVRLNTKWCSDCGKRETDVRAKRCGPCGGSLCHEKYCPRCGERYEGSTSKKYCAYCDEKTPLRAQ